MAAKTILAIPTALTTPADADLFPIWDVGAAATKKITLANVLRPATGSVYGTIKLAGDLAGTGAAPTVVAATTGSKGLIQLAGDLAGTATAPTVVAATTGSKGLIQLAGDLAGTATAPTVVAATAGAKGIIQLAGDLAGTATAPTVVAATTGSKGLIQLAGDLAGTATAPTVVAAATGSKGIVQLAQDLGGTATAPTVIAATGDGTTFPVTADIMITRGVATPAIYVEAQNADVTAPADLTITSQGPYAAATGSKRNPGNIVLAIPTAVSGGTEGTIRFNVAGSNQAAIGSGFMSVGTGTVSTTGTLRGNSSFSLKTRDGSTDVNIASIASSVVSIGDANNLMFLNGASYIAARANILYHQTTSGAADMFTIERAKITVHNSNAVPSGNPTGGAYMYADSGDFSWRCSSGSRVRWTGTSAATATTGARTELPTDFINVTIDGVASKLARYAA